MNRLAQAPFSRHDRLAIPNNPSNLVLLVLGNGMKFQVSSVFSPCFVESTPVTPVADGSPCGYLTDLSCNGYHLTQATTANKATFRASHASFNGKPVLDFDGGDYYQKAFGATYNQPNTSLIVFRMATTGNQYIVDGMDATHRNVVGRAANYVITAGTLLTGGSPNTNPHIAFFIANGASSCLYIDGVSVIAGNAGAQSIIGLTLGCYYSLASAFFVGQLSEIVIYNGLPSNAQLNAIGAFWSSLYGVAYTPIP